MPYTPIAYTTQATVSRLLRVSNAQIKIGDDEDGGQITAADVAAYVLDASRFIDMTVMQAINSSVVPITTYTNYPEIGLAAPRIAAFFIFRDMYKAYKTDNTPTSVIGWIEDARDYLKTFIDNLNNGCYPAISAATGGPGWETASQYFQAEIGVEDVHSLIGNRDNTAPTITDNIGPYTED